MVFPLTVEFLTFFHLSFFFIAFVWRLSSTYFLVDSVAFLVLLLFNIMALFSIFIKCLAFYLALFFVVTILKVIFRRGVSNLRLLRLPR